MKLYRAITTWRANIYIILTSAACNHGMKVMMQSKTDKNLVWSHQAGYFLDLTCLRHTAMCSEPRCVYIASFAEQTEPIQTQQ